MNALNQTMIYTLYDYCKKWEDPAMVSAVFVKGEGKAFCAGGDVKAVTKRYKNGEKKEVLHFFKREYQLNQLIATMRTPYVAFMDGVTMGGGAGISAHGHFRIATENTLFAMPECGLGLFTDVGATHFLTHLIRYELGLFMALTGARIRGRDLTEIGIATHFVPSFKLPLLEERLSDIRWGGRDAEIISNLIEDIAEPHGDVELSEKTPTHPIVAHRSEIIEVFMLETVEEIKEELRKRAEKGSAWSQDAYNAIDRSSPTSLKVTFEALKRASTMSLNDSLQMEYRMLHRFMEGNDFYEGVRAILLDKDNAPVWKPDTLESVTKEMVAEYFAPVEEELLFSSDSSNVKSRL